MSTPDGKVKTLKAKGKKPPKEVWNPRFLGSSYVIKGARPSTLKGESGIHQRAHLRRGHYKQQPYGPGRSLRRQVLIDPYWAGGKDSDD